jgi:hypothetical protein
VSQHDRAFEVRSEVEAALGGLDEQAFVVRDLAIVVLCWKFTDGSAVRPFC